MPHTPPAGPISEDTTGATPPMPSFDTTSLDTGSIDTGMPPVDTSMPDVIGPTTTTTTTTTAIPEAAPEVPQFDGWHYVGGGYYEADGTTGVLGTIVDGVVQPFAGGLPHGGMPGDRRPEDAQPVRPQMPDVHLGDEIKDMLQAPQPVDTLVPDIPFYQASTAPGAPTVADQLRNGIDQVLQRPSDAYRHLQRIAEIMRGRIERIGVITPMIGIADLDAIVRRTSKGFIPRLETGIGNTSINDREQRGSFRQFVLIKENDLNQDRQSVTDKLASLGLELNHPSVIILPERMDMSLTEYLMKTLQETLATGEEVDAKCISVALSMNDDNRSQVKSLIGGDTAKVKSPVNYLVVAEDRLDSNIITYNLGNILSRLLAEQDATSFMALGYSEEELEDIVRELRKITASIRVIAPEDIHRDIDSIIRTLMATSKAA
jgi:hypothetical protein